jgi:uncharacterized protein (DUF427 family)
MGQDGIESVWDYPRPPRLEACERRVRVVHGGVVLADTVRSRRTLETSHPPVYYLAPEDVAMKWMRRSARRQSFCEFKGLATYWSIELPGQGAVEDAAWSYEQPSRPYAALKGLLAFYASRVDECFVDGERVVAQPGDFYGGWITSHVSGPFKGAPGTMGW